MKVYYPSCLLEKVTNPGQNESQGLPTLCDRLDREGDIEVIRIARMNSITGGGGGGRKRPSDWPKP